MRRKIIFYLLVVFIIIFIIGFWYWQKNIYSKEVLKLEILASEEVQAGEEIEYLVKFKNNGKVRLESPELIFQAPERSILEGSQVNRKTQTIEDIYPGEERSYSFKVRLFGKENEIMEVKTWLSYIPKNLKARFESKTTFSTRIKFVPLTFEFDLPSKIGGSDQISFSLNYFSNIDYLLENLRVKIEYPEGFSYLSSSPEALEETEWQLPSLFQAAGGKIEIKGTLEGKEGENKVFRAQLGIVKNNEFWLLKEASQSIKLVESSLYLSYLINNSQNYIASAGELLHYEIFFRNIGQEPVQKKFLFVKLDGDFFDLNSLKSENGEFGQGDNTILWDWKNISDLRFLDVADEGKVEFWVRVKENVDRQIKEPVLKATVSLGGVEKIFETKIRSQVILSQKVFRQQEFFENSGPLPPQVGEVTEYVIVWQVKNSWNNLKNVKLRSILPANVRPTGNIFPEDAKFTYDSASRTVMWNVGKMEAWQGYNNDFLTLAFQIELIPSSSQRGSKATLIGEAEISGDDDWTGEIIREKAGSCDTGLADDGSISSGDKIVQ